MLFRSPKEEKKIRIRRKVEKKVVRDDSQVIRAEIVEEIMASADTNSNAGSQESDPGSAQNSTSHTSQQK